VEAMTEGQEEEAIFTVNMVVHISKDKQDDSKLMKTILNPME
jgi:hypothetical protein